MSQDHQHACELCSSDIRALIASTGVGRFGVSLGDYGPQVDHQGGCFYYKVSLDEVEQPLTIEADVECGWLLRCVRDEYGAHACPCALNALCLEVKHGTVRLIEAPVQRHAGG